MAIVNLRKHYYPLYTTDTFVEVPDEVAAVMEECRLYENRQEGTGASNLDDYHVIVNRWTETPRIIANRGDILLVCKGSGYGKTIVCDIEQAHIARQIMAIKNQNYWTCFS